MHFSQSIPPTTYMDLGKQSELKRYYTKQDWRKQLVQEKTYGSSKLDRETEARGEKFKSALPEIPDLLEEYLTTSVDHFRRPFPPMPLAVITKRKLQRQKAYISYPKALAAGPSFIDVPSCILLQEEQPTADWSRAVKRTLSQFTDTDNHRRVGRNSWIDESGHYFNSHLKAVCPTYRRRLPPFLERLT